MIVWRQGTGMEYLGVPSVFTLGGVFLSLVSSDRSLARSLNKREGVRKGRQMLIEDQSPITDFFILYCLRSFICVSVNVWVQIKSSCSFHAMVFMCDKQSRATQDTKKDKAVSHTCIFHYYLPTTFYLSLFSLSSCTFFSNSANASSAMG